MDSWTEKQLNFMIMGGNHKLRQFFESYNIYHTAAEAYKFRTKAAEYYRQMLKDTVENNQIAEPPTYEEGLQQIEQPQPSYNFANYQGQGSEAPKEDGSKWDEFASKSKAFFQETADKTVDFTKKTYGKAKDKMNDPQTKEDFDAFKEKSINGSKQVARKTEEVAKKGFSFMKTGILSAYSSIKSAVDKK